MRQRNTADRIFSRARNACEERNPESRGSAVFGPSPSSSPLQGEGTAKWAPRVVGVGIVAIYRAAISPVIHALNGPACRFEPSCSEYARDAIAMHGMIRGGAMAIWRIARCNPVGGHGFDPVPARGDGIVNRARIGSKERNPESRSSAIFGPSPSSSPLLGEGTENCAELSSRGEVTAKTAVSFSPFAGEETA